MTKKAMEITSQAHAMAITLYLMMAIIGVSFVIGVPMAPSLTDLLGERFTGAWALMLIFSGGLCAISCIVPHQGSATKISRALIVEFWAALALALTASLYIVALIISFGDGTGKGVTTLMFASLVAFGCLARDAQIWFDLRRIRRARANTGVARVVADPRDD